MSSFNLSEKTSKIIINTKKEMYISYIFYSSNRLNVVKYNYIARNGSAIAILTTYLAIATDRNSPKPRIVKFHMKMDPSSTIHLS